MKKLVALICTFVIFMSTAITCYALPNTIQYGDVGNATDLLVIKKPENAQSQSNKKVYPLSGISVNGCTVYVYIYNPSLNAYTQMYSSDGRAQKTAIGASGLFGFNAELLYGDNYIVVASETASGDRNQKVFLKINLVSQIWINNIKSIISGGR